jgi:hypothetical protein
MQRLLQARLLLPADRKFKKAKPGKKKVVKWPRTLEAAVGARAHARAHVCVCVCVCQDGRVCVCVVCVRTRKCVCQDGVVAVVCSF